MPETLVSPKQKQLVRNILAKPELLKELQIKPNLFDTETPRTVVQVLWENGTTFANPTALLEAITEHETLQADVDELIDLFKDVPLPSEVSLPDVVDLKRRVQKEVEGRKLTREALTHAKRLEQNPDGLEDFFGAVNDAQARYRAGGAEVFDVSGSAIFSRAKLSPPGIRWKCGIPALDVGFHGLDANQEPTQALLAQKELAVLAAKYKGRKTTTALNWAGEVLKSGGSVVYLGLEDNELAFTSKLCAAVFDVEHWKIVQHALGVLKNASPSEIARIEQAIAWIHSLGNRWKVYDGDHPHYNVFSWADIVEIIETEGLVNKPTLVILDYAQQVAVDYEAQSAMALASRRLAQTANVALLVLSQQSNEDIKSGGVKGYLPTKNAGEWGAAAHVGITLRPDPVVGDKEIQLEIAVSRHGGMGRKLWLHFVPETGHLPLDGVSDTPLYDADVIDPEPKKARGKKTA